MGQKIRSSDDVVIDAGDGTSGAKGDLIFKTNGVERARIDRSGNFTGFSATGSTAAIATFSQSGGLSAGTGASRFLMPGSGTITGVVASAGTAPTGQPLICDVNKNGVTIFTTQANRPTIAAGNHATTTEPAPNVTTFVAGDYLTVDVDQVGSGTAGSDLVVNVVFTLS